MQPAAAFSMKDNWDKAFSVYNQLVAKYGEANVLAAAGKLKDIPKDSEGKIAGDPQNHTLAFLVPGAFEGFQSGHPGWPGRAFPRHLLRSALGGKTGDRARHRCGRRCRYAWYAAVRDHSFQRRARGWLCGILSLPRHAAIQLRQQFCRSDRQDYRGSGRCSELGPGRRRAHSECPATQGSGLREASANFRESQPAWLSGAMPATVDGPEYLAWKKFPPGTKVVLESRLLSEASPGTDQYTRTLISRITMHLDSVDDTGAIVTATSTDFPRNGPPRQSEPDQLIYPARKSPEQRDNTWTTTTGEETLVINGKKIATKWESVARANDPMTFTKMWRSNEVPGGLVHRLAQQHTEIGGKPYRTIREEIYAPIDGVMPVLGDATPPAQQSASPAPPGAPRNVTLPNRGAPNAAPQPPGTAPNVAPNVAPNAATNRLEFQRRLNADMNRITRARAGLAPYQTRGAPTSTVLPAAVTAAAARLNADAQAARLAISAGNDSSSERNLKALEDSLKVIEDFLAK